MSSSSFSPAEAILVDLLHDLRQNLGNIETSVYCLSRLDQCAQHRARGFLHTIEQQVACAESRLSAAGAELTRLRVQRDGAAEILALTNSASSVVT